MLLFILIIEPSLPFASPVSIALEMGLINALIIYIAPILYVCRSIALPETPINHSLSSLITSPLTSYADQVGPPVPVGEPIIDTGCKDSKHTCYEVLAWLLARRLCPISRPRSACLRTTETFRHHSSCSSPRSYGASSGLVTILRRLCYYKVCS